MRKELKSISVKKVEGGSEVTTVEFIPYVENLQGYVQEKMIEYNNINNEQQRPSFSARAAMMSSHTNLFNNGYQIDTVSSKDALNHIRDMCTHKYKDKLTLEEQKDGSVICNICNSKFNIIEDTDIVVSETNIKDIIQNIKLYYLDINRDDLYNIIDLLYNKKYTQVDYNYIKSMHTFAIGNFKKYENKYSK